MSVSIEEYQEASDSYLGYCYDCKDFTRDCTEPDATGYDCPECSGTNVVGADILLLDGNVC